MEINHYNPLEVRWVKKLKFKISIPIKGLQSGKDYDLEIKDEANFIETLALVDKMESESLENKIFPIHEGYIHNYLQLFVNLDDETIYEDVGLSPYAPDDQGLYRKFNPIREDIKFNLYPDTIIELQQDVGCWWEKVKNRLDIGTFKRIIMAKYGKENEFFAHYFKLKRNKS